MKVRDLGLIEYSAALKVQEDTVALVLKNGLSEETLLACEHPTVITVGRALGSASDVLNKNIPTFEVSRGGRSTLHLPGQVIIYPILNLEQRGKDLHAYLRLLEEAIIQTLADFRVLGERIEGKTGVWIKKSKINDAEKKIASLGIAIKEWVTYHGLALNVNCDLSIFANLNPCGFSSDVMTSVMNELDDAYKTTWAVTGGRLMKDVKTRLLENLQNLLEMSAENASAMDQHAQGVNQ